MLRELIALDNKSKVWVYQADREFSYDELDIARPEIFSFVDQWTSHHKSVSGYGNIFHRRFLALFVDETHAAASGCSIDSSVNFIKEQGRRLGIDFFNRMQFTYLDGEDVKAITSNDLPNALASNLISEETLFFDNLVKTKGEFLKSWVKPLKDSWHKNFIG